MTCFRRGVSPELAHGELKRQIHGPIQYIYDNSNSRRTPGSLRSVLARQHHHTTRHVRGYSAFSITQQSFVQYSRE